MKIIINIEDDATIPNGKLVEMEAIYMNEKRKGNETQENDIRLSGPQ